MSKLSGFFDPPLFAADGHLEAWRKKVGQWVDSLKVAHDQGTDRTFQTMFNLLVRTLYERGLPDARKAIVDEAQSKGQLDYDDPVQAALSIVKLVAVDPPMSMVTRLISSYQKVTFCRRDRIEKLSSFVSRFRRLAAKHLLHVNTFSSSQIGEMLAITLPNNANLEYGTLTNAKLQLIAHNEARNREKESSVVDTKLVSKANLNNVLKIAEKMKKIDIPLCESDSTPDEYKKSSVGLPIANNQLHTLPRCCSRRPKGDCREQCGKNLSCRLVIVQKSFLQAQSR